ncbi:carboxy terminal-processing peptidase [Chryseosolibacter indicus]|uniref:Carboxy terminal-processing peptidase n=1 Tax=Chryseosolibacter indicus TaxID=2782351 RepID=A0ABS5VKG5_9BACT|nr:carboxy terminal-processing peptidase [Chryseosolibacter indicus]MBT1701871.1 carboxy terminal-processing peptidase [Chryseosolibacter indicus]
MKRILLGIIAGLGLVIQSLAFTAPSDTTELKAKPIYGKEAKVIAYILDNNHYRKLQLSDSLSSAILDGYVSNLDNNKTYFTAKDIASFEKYRYVIDDLTRSENVDPAFTIYSVFKKRFDERMTYVINNLVNRDFDYTTDEFYETDRDKEPWCKNEAELNEVWRKIIKSQALSLKLAGKPAEEIKKTLKERYERLIKSYTKDVNSEDIFGIYMNTITEAYDPHTNYFSPAAADRFKQSISLSLEGIGARLQTDNDYTKVVEVLPGGPAEKTGLVKVNDRIVGVGQGDSGEIVDVIGWRIDDVVKLIKGPKGTKVKLHVLPAEKGVSGKPDEIVLVRDKIKLEDQQAKKNVINYQKDGKAMKLGVITLPSFYMDFEAYQKGDPNYNSTTRDVQKLIKELQTEGVDGLVLDLRNNGGGSLAEAIDLTGLFIKNGPVVQVKNSANRVEVGTDDDSNIAYSGPLVVLTNRFSASASEIFAGAIQDYHRGVVVGESTYGKGTVQTVIDLDRFITDGGKDVGQLKLTFQKFYRVTGSSTQHKGVTPDIKLPSALSSEQFGESSSKSALPWDEIRGTLYQRTPIINDRIIAALNKNYVERLKNDQTLGRFVTETEEARKSLKDTRISLNEAVRKKEMEEAEKRSASAKLNTKIGSKELPITTNLNDLDDEYLREGLFVLSDLITSKIG